MIDKAELKTRLEFWKESLERLRAAYWNLLEGGIKSYTIGPLRLTYSDLPDLEAKIQEAERKVDELTTLLAGKKPRYAFRVIPIDR